MPDRPDRYPPAPLERRRAGDRAPPPARCVGGRVGGPADRAGPSRRWEEDECRGRACRIGQLRFPPFRWHIGTPEDAEGGIGRRTSLRHASAESELRGGDPSDDGPAGQKGPMPQKRAKAV